MEVTKKYSKKWIGKEFITNEGYIAKVIDGGSKNGYCTIQINDWISEAQVSHLKKGKAKNPFHRSVRNVGYIGVGKYSIRINCKIVTQYRYWSHMIERCYDPKSHKRCPTYIGCSVDPKWHNYQVFAKWFDENYVEGWELDKDLLVEGNKIYSPETCIFIPQHLNSFLANNQSSNKSGYTGVSWNKYAKKYVSQITNAETGEPIHIGYYTSIEEA